MPRCLVFASLMLVFIQSCLPATVPPSEDIPTATVIQAAAASSTPTPKETAPLFLPTWTAELPTETPTSTPTVQIPSRTPTPTMRACLQAGGRVEVYEFITVLLPDPLVYRIYLPPCYDEETERTYPVLYLVHGQSYNDTQWDRLGVPETADRLIREGETAPFIVVMPRDRVWREPPRDNFGLAVEQSLVPWIDEHYRTIPDRNSRAVGGLSRGGAWAVNIGFSHPEIFGAVGVHSGFVFHSDVQELHQWLNNFPEGKVPRIYMDIADKDRPEITVSAIWLEEMLTRYDIPHEWHMFAGEHEEDYWQAHVEDYLRWYSQDWGK